MAQARIGDTVRVHYEGRLADGTVFATSIDRPPAELTIGAHRVIPVIEKAIVGMVPDESKTISIAVKHALERSREKLVPTLCQEAIAADPHIDVRRKLRAIDTDGQSACSAVLEISEQIVTINTNDPLAGEDLTFEILLVEIL